MELRTWRKNNSLSLVSSFRNCIMLKVVVTDWFGTCVYQAAGAIIDNNWVVTTREFSCENDLSQGKRPKLAMTIRLASLLDLPAVSPVRKTKKYGKWGERRADLSSLNRIISGDFPSDCAIFAIIETILCSVASKQLLWWKKSRKPFFADSAISLDVVPTTLRVRAGTINHGSDLH